MTSLPTSSVLLLVSGCLFAYPFVIYPLLIASFVRRRAAVRARLPRPVPSVALVICAHNEQKVMRQKIENSLALEYPDRKLRVVVVSDGSTDNTVAVVRSFVPAIELIEQPVRRGKIANLNHVLSARTEDILVLSDANVFYDRAAVVRLVERFEDPEVGCVSGKVVLTDSAPILNQPMAQYYSLEWTLQEKASDLYSMAGADGAMYALRRELFRPCPHDTLIEDFTIPMSIVRQGRRVVFEPRAVAWEQGPSDLREEFRRKVRIAAGATQGLLRGNIWPRNAPCVFWFVFVSHKLLRWFSPIVGLAIVGLLAVSLNEPFARVLALALVCAGALAVSRVVTGWRHPVFSAPFYFLFGQVALAVGLAKGLMGRQTVLWAKANR